MESAFPARCIFVSRNLEYVLHDVIESVASKEKEPLARLFRKRYAEDLDNVQSLAHFHSSIA